MSENHEVEYLLSVIRELALALDLVRGCCEHSEGKEPDDEERMARGMSVGIVTLEKHKQLVDGFHTAAYWQDVTDLRKRLDKERLERWEPKARQG